MQGPHHGLPQLQHGGVAIAVVVVAEVIILLLGGRIRVQILVPHGQGRPLPHRQAAAGQLQLVDGSDPRRHRSHQCRVAAGDGQLTLAQQHAFDAAPTLALYQWS